MRYKAWLEQGRRLRVRDRHLFVVDRGQGPVVLFLHGFPTSSHDFAPLLPHLGDGYRLVLFDMLGFGDSDKPYPYDYSLFEQADFTEELMRQLGISEVFLVAHDMGDTVAQELIRRGGARSFRIHKVLLLNGGMVSGAYSPMWIQQLLKMPGLGDVMAFLTNELTFRLNFEKLFAQDQPTHVYRDAYESVTRRNGKRCYSRLIRYMNEREEWNNWWLTALAHSDIPVELVWGMQDPVSGPAVAHGVVKRVLRATFTPLGTVEHYPQIEAPGRVAERILEFFGTPHTEDD